MIALVEIGKNLALGIRPLRERRCRSQVGAGYDVTKNDPEYVQNVFAKHFGAWSKRFADPPRHVLEIGPGGNTLVAELFLEAGARKGVTAPMSVCAKMTDAKLLKKASIRAEMLMTAVHAAMSVRFRRVASTAAPAGLCMKMPTSPATVSATPISCGFQRLVTNAAARKGPTPVCTSATKKFSQSSACRLREEGAGWVFMRTREEHLQVRCLQKCQ